MKRNWLKISTLSAIAVTLVAYGCDSVSESALVGPSDHSEVRVVKESKGGYRIVTETDPTVGTVSAEIGRNGGSLNIGEHVLTIPAGAVDRPAIFTMSKAPGSVSVELTATRWKANDVGAAGFNVPVTLALSYAQVAGPGSPSKMQVAWLKPDRTIEIQPTVLNSGGQQVIGTLTHFSAYMIIIPE